MSPSLQKACPLLAARDIDAAVRWYERHLGFRIERNQPDHGIVHRDSAELHFWRCTERHIAENTGAYLYVSHLDELFRAFKGASEGGRLIVPETKPWGMREFHVIDPDGNLLRFGEIAGPHAVA